VRRLHIAEALSYRRPQPRQVMVAQCLTYHAGLLGGLVTHELGGIAPKPESCLSAAGGSPGSFLVEHAVATPSTMIAMKGRYFISRAPDWAAGVFA
jgi:hypothetical protein